MMNRTVVVLGTECVHIYHECGVRLFLVALGAPLTNEKGVAMVSGRSSPCAQQYVGKYQSRMVISGRSEL